MAAVRCNNIARIDGIIEDSPSSCIKWQLFKEFLEEDDELQQVSILKKFGSGLRKLVCPGFEASHLEDLISILTDIHVNTEARSVLRRTIVSVLQSLPDTLHGSIINALQAALTNHIASCDQSDQSSCRIRIDTIQSLMENFSLGEAALKATLHPVFAVMEDVLRFFITRIRNNTEETAIGQSEMMHHCLATVKTARVLVHKCWSELRDEVVNIDSKLWSCIHSIRNDACHILKDGLFFADCQNAAGMTLIQIMYLLSDQELPAKEIADELFSESDAVKAMLIDYQNLPPLSKLFVCQGVLATVPNGQLTMFLTGDDVTGDDASLLGMMFHQIWSLVSVLMESFSALSVARALALWTTCALSYVETKRDDLHAVEAFTGYQDVPQKLLEYSWTNWDHPIDCMRHQVNSIFSNIIKLHRKSTGYSGNADCSDDTFMCDVLQKILSSDRHVRGKYTFLACIVENIGAEFILKQNPALPRELYICILDQNLSPCVGNLVEVMAKDHLKRMTDSSVDDWHRTWIDSLLCALHTCPPIQQKSYIMQVTLPKLMRCNLSSAQYIIETLQSSKWKDLDAQGTRCLDAQCSKPLDAQGMRLLDAQGSKPLDAQGLKPLDAQGSKPLDAQGSKPLDAQDSKPLDTQGSKPLYAQVSKPLDAQGSKSLDYKGMRLCMLMTCLKTARASNLTITECDDDEQHDKMWHGLVGKTTIRQALCHKNNQVRLDTFALICDTKKTAEALTDCDFDLIKFFLPYNLSSHLPSFRQQLMMLIKKLLIRLQDSGRLHYKNSKASNCPNQSEAADRLHTYKDFLDWFVKLLFSGLGPGSCYSTRVSSLTALSNLCKFQSGCSWYDEGTIFSPKNVQLLLRCFTDPYESNKVMAFNLLVPLSQEQLELQDIEQLNALYKVAFELGSSTRPHNCETASFMLRFLSRQLEPAVKHSASYHDNLQGILGDLLDSLSEQVEVADRRLIEAAGSRPMYGVLHCIRELIADVKFNEQDKSVTANYKQLIDKLLVMCYKVAEVVSPVVCNSSPEGYLPANQERDGADVSQFDEVAAVEPTSGSKVLNVTPQALLVCCWRSMKEVSLTLGKISQQHEKSQALLSQQQVIEMGDFFIKLLLESKHRGAFELASVGFNQLCVVLWRSTIVPLQSLPKKWLNDLLNDICAGGDLLCATRRSAGVPFTIQALVTSEPSSLRRKSLQEAMAILLPLVSPAQQNTKDITPQVHAMNIMCALFRDTRLGEDVYPFIADGMRASILGFKSQLWIVRNSSTLLFTALMNRIFGVRRETEELARKNCMTGREFFTRFPSLHAFLLEELSACIGTGAGMEAGYLQPSLFPILLLLSRLYPSPTDGADSNLSLAPFIPMVQRCGSSAIYKTRTMAARALASLIPSGEIIKMVESLISSLPKCQMQKYHQNQIHGLLLQVHMLLQNHLKGHHQTFGVRQQTLLQQSVSSFKDCIWLATSSNRCAVTRAEFLTILNTFVMESSWLQTHFTGLVHEAELGQLQEHVAMSAYDDDSLSDAISLDHVTLMKAIANTLIHSFKSDFSAKSRQYLRGKVVQESHQERDSAENNALLSDDFKSECCTLTDSLCTCAVIQHLSSNIYEVRLLILEHILDKLKEDSCCGCDHECERARRQNICKSKDVFNQLVSMLASEKHHDCKVKLLEVLSQHPMARRFPWLLVDGRQLTCLQVGHLILSFSRTGGGDVRDDLVGGVLAFSSVLIPFVYESITEDVEDQSGKDFIRNVVELMKMSSFAEHTTQLRLAIAQTLNNTTLYILIDQEHRLGDITMTGWDVVLRLLQDSDSDVRASITYCVRTLAKQLPSIPVDSWFYWDVHSNLALQLAVDIMIEIHHSKNICSLYKMIFSWVMGEPEDFILEEIEDDKLFDRGEANTNNEEVTLLKILVKSFSSVADVHNVKSKLNSALSQSILIARLEEFLSRKKYEQLTQEKGFVDATSYENVELELMHLCAGFVLLQKTNAGICLRKVNELWSAVQEKCDLVGYKFDFDELVGEMCTSINSE